MSQPIDTDACAARVEQVAGDLLENIVSLTEQRDQLSLEYSLFNALEEVLAPEALLVIELRADHDEYRPIHMHEAAELAPELLAAARALDADAHCRVRAGGHDCLLLRIEPALQENRHILILCMPAWNPMEQRMALGMLQVYRNYVRLLFDSERDTLTGLMNRKKFERRLNDLVTAHVNGRRCQDRVREDYLAILDLDRFKSINDTYGHLIGDEVLLAFANLMRESLRDVDQIYRYGGEEFVILLEDTSREAASRVLERLRARVEAHAFPQVGQVTVSIGYTRVDGGKPPALFIEEADRALYYVKEHGRNRSLDYAGLDMLKPRAVGSAELF